MGAAPPAVSRQALAPGVEGGVGKRSRMGPFKSFAACLLQGQTGTQLLPLSSLSGKKTTAVLLWIPRENLGGERLSIWLLPGMSGVAGFQGESCQGGLWLGGTGWAQEADGPLCCCKQEGEHGLFSGATPAHRITSPSHRITSPVHWITVPAHRITAPAHWITAPAHRITSPAHGAGGLGEPEIIEPASLWLCGGQWECS